MNKILAAALLLITAVPANAVVINVNDIGASGTTTIQGFVGPSAQAVTGLQGTLFLSYQGAVINMNGTQTWNFDYTVTNTSFGPNVTSSSITSFGLNTTPNLTGASSTGLYDLALLNPSFSNVGGANAIEVCFSAGNNSCNGNGNTLPMDSDAVSGDIFLTFANPLLSISLDQAYLRFQDLSAGSTTATSGVGISNGVNITPVIAPVPGPLLGAGLPGLLAACGGLILLARRRRNHQIA